MLFVNRFFIGALCKYNIRFATKKKKKITKITIATVDRRSRAAVFGRRWQVYGRSAIFGLNNVL